MPFLFSFSDDQIECLTFCSVSSFSRKRKDLKEQVEIIYDEVNTYYDRINKTSEEMGQGA